EEQRKRENSRAASHAPATPPLFAIGAPTPDVDHAGSSRVYVESTSASQMNAATTMSHHDSRTRRAKRGDSVASVATVRPRDGVGRRKLAVSFLFKNMDLFC